MTNETLKQEDFTFVTEREDAEEIRRPSMNYWQDAWRRLKRNRLAVVSLAVLVMIGIFCVIGPWLTPYGYEELSMVSKNQGPGAEHWFGTDKMGRDLFTRIWIGGRVSMTLGLVGAMIDITVGMIYGGISAYCGGKVDDAMMRIVEILAGIPYLVLVVLVSLIVGKGISSLLIAMTLTGWCHMARLVRGQIFQIKEQDYILAARALGTPAWKIIWRHLLPNTIGVMIVSVTFDIPSFIFGEAFLSYIGLGIQSPMTSWGALASGAQQQMNFYPYQLFFPALFISLTMLSFQILGDGLRDALDPKLRQ